MVFNESVCIVGEFPPPPGGMAIQAEMLMQSLKDARVNVSPVPTYAAVRSSTLLKFLSFNVRLLRSLGRTSVVHVFSHSYISFFLFTLPPVLWGKWFGKKVVVNYHGGSADAFFSASSLAKNILRKADAVVVSSGFLKAVFDKHGVSSRIVANICNLDRFRFQLRETPAPRIIVARHLEPVYNVACAVRAFALVREKFPQAQLLIAGSGSEERKIRELAESFKLGESVRFLGNVPNENMSAVYQQADIFLNSSNVDNLPVAILEAFACGLPVVSTRAGGIPYVVEHGATGLLADIDDSQALAAAVTRLLTEQGLAAALSKRAYETLYQYDKAHITKQWIEVYESLP